MTTLERIQYVAQLAFDFDFEEYLKRTGKKVIILEVDTIQKRFLPHYGHVSSALIERVNESYEHAQAGFTLDAHLVLSLKDNTALFLFSDITLNSNPIDLDTIIIHELSHFMVLSRNEVQPSIEAYKLGREIYDISSPEYDEITQHTEDYCRLLAQGCINYNEKTRNFRRNADAAKSAMRFDMMK